MCDTSPSGYRDRFRLASAPEVPTILSLGSLISEISQHEFNYFRKISDNLYILHKINSSLADYGLAVD